MDIRSVDLNLLVIFDAMARKRSVIRTAEAVGLSQPATSAALARLRTLFDDALFVRAGSEMKPTPRALELAPVVQRVVETINTEILQQTVFDPALAERSFTILTPDIGEIAFIPGVLRSLRVQAPSVHLKAMSLPPKAAAEALESGVAELAVGFFPDLQKTGFFQQGLFKTSYACIACTGNKMAGKRMSMKQFLSANHGPPPARGAGVVAFHEPVGDITGKRPDCHRAGRHCHRGRTPYQTQAHRAAIQTAGD